MIRQAVKGPIAPVWALPEVMAINIKSPSNLGGIMPRIADRNVDGVAFLHRTRDEAERRLRGGGSAFLVGRELAGTERIFGHRKYLSYLISNRHVVFDHSACVASVNRRDGGPLDIWDIDQNDWYEHPNGDDLVATCASPNVNTSLHKVSFIPESRFITQDLISKYDIGLGDEVFMIGRFYNLQGNKINRPALRLGNISMMAEQIWLHREKRAQESFAVELRSKEGFSGSPVAIWRRDWTYLGEKDLDDDARNFWALLGVNWGYVLDEHGENTWLNGVVPAWKITELLDRPELRAIHLEHERQIAKYADDNGMVQSAYEEDIGDDGDTGNPHHKEDFNRLLGAAVQKPK